MHEDDKGRPPYADLKLFRVEHTRTLYMLAVDLEMAERDAWHVVEKAYRNGDDSYHRFVDRMVSGRALEAALRLGSRLPRRRRYGGGVYKAAPTRRRAVRDPVMPRE